MTRVRRVLTALILSLLAVARSSAAQAVVESFSALPEVIHKGNVVFVQDEKGERTKGKITDLSATSLRIMTGGVSGRTLTFPADRVMRVSKADSRWNGFIIGALAGAVPGLILGHGFKQWCINESGSHCDNQYAYWGGFLGLVGGWIGYAVDGAIDGQTLVFRRGGASAALRVTSIVTNRPAGVRHSFRF